MAPGVFPFLELATETRLPIYRLVLPYSEYHADSDRQKNDCPIEWHHGSCPSILFVNRQIHREVTDILYRENAFAIYVRHPRAPRLPMNESRADPESFVLISWEKKAWSNPRNPRLPYSILKTHQSFQNIRQLHVSLPPLDDLLGIDLYMQKSSYAAYQGINGWIRKCSKAGGRIDDQELERMNYIQLIKQPIDQVADLVKTLPRIDKLWISLQARDREISFAKYMLQGFLTLRKVTNAFCFYVPRRAKGGRTPWNWGNPDNPLLEDLKATLENPLDEREDSHLPISMEEMYWMLQSIRAKQQLELDKLPIWVQPMAA